MITGIAGLPEELNPQLVKRYPKHGSRVETHVISIKGAPGTYEYVFMDYLVREGRYAVGGYILPTSVFEAMASDLGERRMRPRPRKRQL